MPPRRSAPDQVNTIHITTIAPETAISARRIIDAITLTSALERSICDNVPCWRTAANPGAVTLCYAKAGEPRRHSNVAPEGSNWRNKPCRHGQKRSKKLRARLSRPSAEKPKSPSLRARLARCMSRWTKSSSRNSRKRNGKGFRKRRVTERVDVQACRSTSRFSQRSLMNVPNG